MRSSPHGSGEVVGIGASVACVAYFVAVWISLPSVAGDMPFALDGSNALLRRLSNGY